MLIQIREFSGISPKIAPTELGQNGAQIALNCQLYHLDLRAWQNTSPVLNGAANPISRSGTVSSIYKYGQQVSADGQYWFQWNQDVDVVRSPTANDSSETTIFSGVGAPQVTNFSNALQGTSTAYPNVSYKLGLPSPMIAPSAAGSVAYIYNLAATFTVTSFLVDSRAGISYQSNSQLFVTSTLQANPSTTGQAGQLLETKSYVYTYVGYLDSLAIESQPSPAFLAQSYNGAPVSLLFSDAIPTGYVPVSSRRLYRSVGTNTGYYLVAEVPIAANVYTDITYDTQLGNQLLSASWTVPQPTLSGFTPMAGGVILAFTGKDIYASEPYRPYTFPASYSLTVDYNVVGIKAYNQTALVGTTGYPYMITGTQPSSYSIQRLEFPHACVSKRSMITGEGAILYASPDGICIVPQFGMPDVLTKAMFDRPTWQALVNPSSISAYWHDRKYIAFFTLQDGVTQGGFVLDPLDLKNPFTLLDFYASAGYVDPRTDSLYLVVNGQLVKWQGATTTMVYQWKSKKFVNMHPQCLTIGRVLADSYPLQMNLYADGVLRANVTVNSELPFRLPSGYRARTYELELIGSSRVYDLSVATSSEEISGGQ